MTKEIADFGKQTELRFIEGCDACKCDGKFPEWFHIVTGATVKEDHDGVDAWAYTDVAKIPIQIKSGIGGRNRHMSRPDRRHIPCIVVSPHELFDRIFAEAIRIISLERDRLLAKAAADAAEQTVEPPQKDIAAHAARA